MSFFFYTHFIKIYTMNRGDTYMTPEERKELQERTKEAIKNNFPIDMIEIDIKEMWNILGKIIGETYEEELINKLFSQFCLGK